MSGQLRVVLVDDHQLVREALRAFLQIELGACVVGEASDGRSAVALAAKLSPDIVIMDINMPNLNGIEATRQIAANGAGPKVIALTGYADTKLAIQVLRAGASAYLTKTGPTAELAKAIEAVSAGIAYASPGVPEAIMSACVHDANLTGTAEFRLSPREREVLQLLAEGHATKQIASSLHVSVKTIETHRKNLMDKLDLDSVALLTKYAIREGITSADA